MSRERYSMPLTWARTGGRLELNAPATSLGTRTAWPPPWPAERTSAEKAMACDLGTTPGVDQLPGAGQEQSGQQDLDHIADQEGQHSQSQCLAERHPRQDHQSDYAKDVDDDVPQRHHANGGHHAPVGA